MGDRRHPSQELADRYVPNPSEEALTRSQIGLFGTRLKREPDMAGQMMTKSVEETLIRSGIEHKPTLLQLTRQPQPQPATQEERLRVLCNAMPDARRSLFKSRPIPTAPTKILDAPGLNVDFYSSCLDWGSDGTLAVALGSTLYTINQETEKASAAFSITESRQICGVRWRHDAKYVAIGLRGENTIQLWIPSQEKKVRTLTQKDGTGLQRGIPNAGCCAIAWEDSLLFAGYGDGIVLAHDVRAKDSVVATLTGHTERVCGLAYNKNSGLLASGADDNNVILWDCRTWRSPIHTLIGHEGAVKAISWCPLDVTVLATGGGRDDRSIKFWNVLTGICTNTVNTGSQILGLLWSPDGKELLTTHGFTDNTVCLWSYPDMTRIAELKAHTDRVLHCALGPNGVTVVTGGDQSLCYWDAFTPPKIHTS